SAPLADIQAGRYSPRVPRYYCLIPNITGDSVLVAQTGDGGWSLPAFECDDAWFALASTAVARKATDCYGVSLTALCERTVLDCRVCELEMHAEQWTPPSGTRWIGSGDPIGRAVEPAALGEALCGWFLEREAG